MTEFDFSFPSVWFRQSYNIGYPSETLLKLKSREIPFAHHLFRGCPIVIAWSKRDLILRWVWDSAVRMQNSHSKPPMVISLQWRHNEPDGVSNNQPHHCLLNRLFRRRSKKTSKLRVVGLCAGNSPVTGDFAAQIASNAENVSIWWCHHAIYQPRGRNVAYISNVFLENIWRCHV